MAAFDSSASTVPKARSARKDLLEALEAKKLKMDAEMAEMKLKMDTEMAEMESDINIVNADYMVEMAYPSLLNEEMFLATKARLDERWFGANSTASSEVVTNSLPDVEIIDIPDENEVVMVDRSEKVVGMGRISGDPIEMRDPILISSGFPGDSNILFRTPKIPIDHPSFTPTWGPDFQKFCMSQKPPILLGPVVHSHISFLDRELKRRLNVLTGKWVESWKWEPFAKHSVAREHKQSPYWDGLVALAAFKAGRDDRSLALALLLVLAKASEKAVKKALSHIDQY